MSRLSFLLMTPMEPSGRATRWDLRNASSRSNCWRSCAIISRPRRCSTYGQGKWYPGELLPRWALSCYWRKDGVPIWENPRLIAEDGKDYGYTSEDARKFLEALTRRLQVDASFAMAAYEDSFYYLWKERRLPVNVDPLDPKLEDPVERKRVARIFEEGLGKLTGYVLPLRRIPTRQGTAALDEPALVSQVGAYFSDPGRFADGIPAAARISPVDQAGRCCLFLRARSVCEARRASRTGLRAGPTFSPRPPRGQMIRSRGDDRAKPPEKGESAPWVSRPALCIQPREGKLFIFMPPVEYVADYLDLVAAIEDTAAHLNMPVMLEGYALPFDPRIRVLKVTPDPGVIEVNIHPAESWDELVRTTEAIYALARETRLGTEKFMMDGQHSGTGGGNHIVIGGPTPADSAFLRRPDLLRSLVGYWHNHPSLSYLFSGMFIGPTSQHPRVDEARTDSIYELEIAFDQIPDKGFERCLAVAGRSRLPAPSDRFVRQYAPRRVLHRQALFARRFRIAARPRGIARIRDASARAHESHATTARARADRTFLARRRTGANSSWWGTTLHDRFMLPHFVQLDWEDVLADLREAGFAFQTEWFAPHFEFRFPIDRLGHQARHNSGVAARPGAVARAWEKKPPAAKPCATWIRPSSGCR